MENTVYFASNPQCAAHWIKIARADFHTPLSDYCKISFVIRIFQPLHRKILFFPFLND